MKRVVCVFKLCSSGAIIEINFSDKTRTCGFTIFCMCVSVSVCMYVLFIRGNEQKFDYVGVLNREFSEIMNHFRATMYT